MKNTYKERKEALLKEAEESKEAFKESVTSTFSISSSQGKKVLFVLGGAAAAYGLVNLYFRNNKDEENKEKKVDKKKSKNDSKKDQTTNEQSFMEMIKKEVLTLVMSFAKELFTELIRRVKDKKEA